MGPVWIQLDSGVYRVRVGPYPTRSRAIEGKERIEAAGMGAIVVNPGKE